MASVDVMKSAPLGCHLQPQSFKNLRSRKRQDNQVRRLAKTRYLLVGSPKEIEVISEGNRTEICNKYNKLGNSDLEFFRICLG